MGEDMTEPQKFLQGQVVNGQYALREYLGGSDHGAVFATEYGTRTPQKAAIKLVVARPGNAEAQLSRWRLAERFSHPNLLRILDFGRCELGNTAMLYLVMEYAEEDLSQILPQRVLSPAEARQMLEPVLSALEYIHSKGFVHGRLRPSNLMAIGDQIKLSSDGMRRIDEARDMQGNLSAYDAPESATGGMSPAGDVWSVGATAVEALTQRLPAMGTEEQKEATLPDNMPAAFADVVAHCLRRDPRRRWTVADLQEWLKRGSKEKEEPVLAATQAETRAHSAARPRWVIPAIAASLIVVAIVAGPKLFERGDKGAEDSPGAVSASSDTPKRTSNSKKAEPKKREEGAPAEPTMVPAKTKAEESAKTAAAGAVAQQVMPQMSEKARETIEGTVRVNVRVKLDESGNVADATLAAPGPSKYFSDLSLKTARQWKFSPASSDGQNVPSEWVLQFGYSQSGAQVNPVRTKP
jgi:TonB family protein